LKMIAAHLSVLLATLSFTCALWPYPQQMSTGTTELSVVQSHFSFMCNTPCPSTVEKAIQRYTNSIFFTNTSGQQVPNSNELIVLSIDIAEENVPLVWNVDESYTLNVSADGTGNLQANNQWGIIRGLESFSQLIEYDWFNNSYSIQVPVNIFDYPRFSWRSLLLDSARHYLSVSTVLRQIDAMAYSKFNILHWHLTDDESFPVESTTYPLLSQKGAWHPSATYSADDIQEIISYATERGVIVVPEFDMPAHAASWGKGYPQLLVECPGEDALMDPTSSFTYTFIQNFLNEMSGLFPSEFVHLGSDEVRNFACWNASQSVNQWMIENNISTYGELQSLFEFQVQSIASSLGKTPILWEESFDHNFSLIPATIIDVWLSNKELLDVVSSGRQGIFSFPYYLDRQIPGPQTFWFFEDTWQDFYAADPVGNANITEAELSRILGGTACMWGESVDDTVIDERIWPRALAVSERLWSSQSTNNATEALPRLQEHRCNMVRRGIKGGPLRPDYCFIPPKD